MSENVPDTNSHLPKTLTIPISPPKPKKRRRELSNAQRAEVRRYFYDDSNNKPSQKQLIQWFEEKHHHKLTQSQVSKILSDQYSFLDGDRWLDRGRNRMAEYPDLEAALHHWELTEGQNVATFLNPVDEIVDDDPDDDHFVEQLAQAYARGPESDPDGPEVPIPEPICIPQALSAVTTLRGFAEQQKEDYRGTDSTTFIFRERDEGSAAGK